MADNQFKDTSATRKIFQLRQRIRAVAGGTSASKTISILIWLIDYAQVQKNKIITVVAESVPHLKLGAMRDFKNIMVAHGYWNDDKWRDSAPNVYTFETGSIIEFISFDKFGKAHGPRRDVLFLNEANNIPYFIADQLITRTREVVWMDWNPSEEFWFYTEMLPHRKDVDFITLTYLDNEALDEVSKMEIESHKNNKQWWLVYGLGQLGEILSRIYTGWQIIDEVPPEAHLERYGLDFGYSNDPTVIEAIYKWNGGFIVDEICYQKGMSNKEIADMLKILPRALVIADSAEPKSIDEIKMYGLNIIGAQKGQGSVLQGIQFVQNQSMSVTKRSVETIKSYRNYMWMTDKDGKIINEPDHAFSDPMDAIRYGLNAYYATSSKKKQPSGGVLPYFPELGI
jgi:phage terminase large subunit